MKQFRRQFDYSEPRHIKKNPKPWPASVVRPDLGLTVRQLMDRHTRYPDDEMFREGNYTGEEEIPMDLDISEIKDLRDNLILNQEKAEKSLQVKKAKAKIEADEKKFQERLKAEIEKSAKKPDKPE